MTLHADRGPAVPAPGRAAAPDPAAERVREVDRQILHLLRTRCSLTRAAPPRRPAAPAPFYPAVLDAERVLDTYRLALGGPGELLARAVLNCCRAAGRG